MELELELNKVMAAYEILDGNAPYSLKNLNLKFKGKTAFKISLLKTKLRDLAIIGEETRQSLIKDKYGDVDADGNYIVSNDKVQLFVNEFNDVLNTKHKINFTPLTFEDIEDVELPIEFSDRMIHFFEV
jgi:hypothetical protein